MTNFLITGCAGFIGWKTAEKLLQKGYIVVGLDNMNDYYDTRLKEYRLSLLKRYENFTFYPVDIEDKESLKEVFKNTPLTA